MSEFDDKIRQTQVFAGLTAEEFEELKQRAFELGTEPGQTPAVVAAGMRDAALAGQDFNEIMSSFSLPESSFDDAAEQALKRLKIAKCAKIYWHLIQPTKR